MLSFSNPIIDILISLTLIYALLSILVSIINEFISHLYEERSVVLKNSIIKLLQDTKNISYGQLFFNHFNIQAITKCTVRRHWFGLFENKKVSNKKTPPAYISSSMFADTLIDIIANQAKHTQIIKPVTDSLGKIVPDANGNKTYVAVGSPVPDKLMDKYKAAIDFMNPSAFKDILIGFYQRADGNLDKMKPLIETWFNDYQDRVSGWYKLKQRSKMVWIGLATAILLNADSLHLVKTLSLDDKLRGELVAVSEKVAANYNKLSDSLKTDLGAMINTFSVADTVVKKISDSISLNHPGLIINKPQLLTDILIKKDSAKYNKISRALLRNDSVSKALQLKADEVLGIAAGLNIPIGYSETSAPLSWMPWVKKTKQDHIVNTTSQSGLIVYNIKRNEGHDVWIYIKYIIGILITGFSLSVGAPFWFSLLVKLVDIRRAGVKPATKTKKES